jgi:hypothetical protein
MGMVKASGGRRRLRLRLLNGVLMYWCSLRYWRSFVMLGFGGQVAMLLSGQVGCIPKRSSR